MSFCTPTKISLLVLTCAPIPLRSIPESRQFQARPQSPASYGQSYLDPCGPFRAYDRSEGHNDAIYCRLDLSNVVFRAGDLLAARLGSVSRCGRGDPPATDRRRDLADHPFGARAASGLNSISGRLRGPRALLCPSAPFFANSQRSIDGAIISPSYITILRRRG